MKKIFIISALLSVALSGCHDAIDIAPVSNPSVANFYRNAADIEAAVAGAYDGLQSIGQYGQSIPFLAEVRSDNSEESDIGASGGIFFDIDVFNVLSDNGVLEDSWRDSYNTIQRCNVVLNRIDGIADMDASVKTTRAGEVKFIRALTYFNLVRIFGDVPLVLTETTNPSNSFGLGRNTATEVYTQIVTDLSEAVTALPATPSEVGRATQGAANALLGKVHLTQGNHALAISALRAVAGYSLLANYADVFGAANENNAESIFEIQYTAGSGSTIVANGLGDGLGEGSAYPNLFAPIGGTSIVAEGQTLGGNRPTTDLWNSFDAADLRRNVSIGQFGPDNILYPNKLMGEAAAIHDSDVNFIVLRYADVLLMLAEALNEQGYAADGEAFDLVNSIRSRAGLADITSATVADQAAFRLAVEAERRHELAFEGHRWFDLVRTDRAIAVMNAHTTESGDNPTTLSIDSHNLIYPIPQREIDTDPTLKQNTGY